MPACAPVNRNRTRPLLVAPEVRGRLIMSCPGSGSLYRSIGKMKKFVNCPEVTNKRPPCRRVAAQASRPTVSPRLTLNFTVLFARLPQMKQTGGPHHRPVPLSLRGWFSLPGGREPLPNSGSGVPWGERVRGPARCVMGGKSAIHGAHAAVAAPPLLSPRIGNGVGVRAAHLPFEPAFLL